MIEIAIPLNVLGPRVAFVVIVERQLDGARVAVGQHPDRSPIFLDVPASDFDARNWRA